MGRSKRKTVKKFWSKKIFLKKSICPFCLARSLRAKLKEEVNKIKTFQVECINCMARGVILLPKAYDCIDACQKFFDVNYKKCEGRV